MRLNPFRRLGRKELDEAGLRITEFPAPVVQLLRLYGLGGSYAQLYASQPNVRTVIDDLAREAAELSIKMYLKDPRGGLLPDARIEVGHPMMDLLEEPMPGESIYRFWFSLFADKAIYDRWLLRKIRTAPGKPPSALLRIPPANLLPFVDPATGQLIEWRAMDGTIVPKEDLIVGWGYDPQVNHGGIPPMETLRRLLADEMATGADRENRWRNALRKEGVIEQDAANRPMSDEARESFLLDVQDSLRGSAGTANPLLLNPGMSWKDINWSPKEMEYLNARKLNRIEVAAAFHYPAAKVLAHENGQDPDDNTLNYFYTSTLPPYLTGVERELEAQLLPEFEKTRATRKTFYVEFNLDAKLRGSFEKQAAIMATTAGGPVITVNEARARLNLPPIEGGDLIFVPLNSIRAGGPQASPQNPVAVPGAPGAISPIGVSPGGGTVPQDPSLVQPVPGVGVAAIPVVFRDEQAKAFLSPDTSTVEQVLAEHDAVISERKDAADHAVFLKETRIRYEERHARAVEKFFGRQRNSVEGGKSADTKRWVKELGDDLYGVAIQTAEKFGADAAERIKGNWSTERTSNFLKVNAAGDASKINEATVAQLKTDAPDLDVVFGDGRVGDVARSRTTFVMNWAIQEAAHQNGVI